MAIFDVNNLFCENQAITADAASTNTIDLAPLGSTSEGQAIVRDIGKGCKVPLTIVVTESFNTLTSLTISLQTDDNTGFASAKTVLSKNYLLAELVAGKQLPFPDDIPEGTNERYMRLYFDVTGTDPTTGKITAGVTAGRQSNMTVAGA